VIDPYQKYLKLPLLAPDVEATLIAQAQAGDRAAMDRLIAHNSRFVRAMVVKRQFHSRYSYEDLMAVGFAGLAHGVSRFEPKRKLKLMTFAMWWIRAYIDRWFKEDQPVHIPSFNRILSQSKDNERIEAAKRARRSLVSLDAPVPWLENTPEPLHEHMEGNVRPSDELYEREESSYEAKRKLDMLVRFLSPQCRLIIRKRFCVDEDDRATLEEIGAELGVSRERVRQLEAQALSRLQKLARSPVSPEKIHQNLKANAVGISRVVGRPSATRVPQICSRLGCNIRLYASNRSGVCSACQQGRRFPKKPKVLPAEMAA